MRFYFLLKVKRMCNIKWHTTGVVSGVQIWSLHTYRVDRAGRHSGVIKDDQNELIVNIYTNNSCHQVVH